MALRSNDINRALLISATGTGKTYASAFAVREMNPSRILFVVHREQIAKQSIRSYKRIFGSSRTFGLVSGSSRELDADFVFSTMQMMTKPEVHGYFRKDEYHAKSKTSQQLRLIPPFAFGRLLSMSDFRLRITARIPTP